MSYTNTPVILRHPMSFWAPYVILN